MNLISYEEQIYLLYYWMKTNLIGFKPTLENIEEQLRIEFDTEDEDAAKEIYKLFNE